MGSGRLRGIAAAAVLSFSLIACGSAFAGASTPVTLAPSATNPNITMDGANTAHLTWTGRGVDSKLLFYCRLPVGADACSPLTQITAPGDSLSIPYAVNDGTAIRVVSYRYGLTSGPSFSNVYVFTSTDGGNSFDAGVATGGNVAPYDTVPGAGSVLFMDSASSCGSCFQVIPTDGSGVTGGPASLSTDHPYLGVLGYVDSNTPLAVFAAGGGAAQFRRFSGTGNLNDANNWLAPVDIGELDWPRLAYGPAGLFLVAQESLSDPDMQVRKYDGTTFGPRTAITSGTRADSAVQDAQGRLHVVGGKFSGGKTGAALFYGTSDTGTNWDTEEIEFPGVPATMRMVVGADHFGIVTGTYATGETNAVWAARIGPKAAEPTTAKFVDVTVVSGTVLIQVPGSKVFKRLQTGDVIPVGSIVDATKGRVRITIALPNGTLQATDFFQGIFKVGQAKSGLATMTLRGGSFAKCGRAAAVNAAKSKKIVRQLWGAGSGKFQTKGRFAAAAIRGTTWDTIDRCDGTLIKVTQGRVLVNDLKKHKKIVVKKGRSYLAKG